MRKFVLSVPKDMVEIAKSADIAEKPYNICLKCPYRGRSCDGPNCLAMEMPRLIEWNDSLAKTQGFTRAKTAERADIPLGTLNSIMTGRTPDPRHSTMQAITRANSGGSWGKYPCHLAAILMDKEMFEDSMVDEEEFAKHELQIVREESNRKVEYLRKEIETHRKEIRKKNISLTIAIVAAALFAAVLVAMLITDMVVPNLGFFWMR